MRMMSFALTTEAVEQRRKTVTRRDPKTWATLKPGDRLVAIEKGMGLPKGSTVRRLAVIEIVSVRVEPLADINDDDVIREGFEGKNAMWFVAMFCKHHGVAAPNVWTLDVRRIEFKYVEDAP